MNTLGGGKYKKVTEFLKQSDLIPGFPRSRQLPVRPSFQKAGKPGSRRGFFDEANLPPAMEGKLKAGAQVMAWQAELLRLHYTVFVQRADFIAFSETLRTSIMS